MSEYQIQARRIYPRSTCQIYPVIPHGRSRAFFKTVSAFDVSSGAQLNANGQHCPTCDRILGTYGVNCSDMRTQFGRFMLSDAIIVHSIPRYVTEQARGILQLICAASEGSTCTTRVPPGWLKTPNLRGLRPMFLVGLLRFIIWNSHLFSPLFHAN